MVMKEMNSILQELILSDGDFSVAPATKTRSGDEQLLDSYSQTIAAVVNRVAPTVGIFQQRYVKRHGIVATETIPLTREA